MSIKIELPARYGHTGEELSFIREMGVEYLNLNVMPDHAGYEDMAREADRLAKYDLKISDLACPPLQKNKDIILGKEGRDRAIEAFIDHIEVAGKIGAPLVSVAWQPNGILRSGKGPGTHTRGGSAFLCDLDRILAQPVLNDREYSREEMWDTFGYFLRRVLPACDKAGVRLALHPNDPPVPVLGGVASLIASREDYDRALALAGPSRLLAVKLCVGCWLENSSFGDLYKDISDFQDMGVLAEVHFRNVSSTLPVFEETLIEDGYADMVSLLRHFIKCGFDGFMSVDHAFFGYPQTGGQLGSLAYPTGYLKGMLHTLESFGK